MHRVIGATPATVAPTPLILIGVSGHILTLAVMVLLARQLSIDAFETFVAAAAIFTILVASAPFGVDKLSLLVLPRLHRRGDWAAIADFLRFAVRRAAFGIVAMAAVGVTWIYSSGPAAHLPEERLALLLAVLVLPVGVAAYMGFEVLTALGCARQAAGIFRVGSPSIVLAVVAATGLAGTNLTSAGAIMIWGLGWLIGAVALWEALGRLRSPAPRGSPDARKCRTWCRTALPLWAYRVGFALMANAGIIALHRLGHPANVVGSYAAAATVATLMSVVVTSTNRAYSRELALLIDIGDETAIRAIVLARWRWLLPAVGGFLTIVFLVPDRILLIFGPAFVAEGVLPLQILATAGALSMVLALTPTRLKHTGRHGLVLGAMAFALFLQVLLLVMLVPEGGASGAAMSFLAGIAGLHLFMAFGDRGSHARKHVEKTNGTLT